MGGRETLGLPDAEWQQALNRIFEKLEKGEEAWFALARFYAAQGYELIYRDGRLLDLDGKVVGHVTNVHFVGDVVHHDMHPVQPINHIDITITV
jgi:hypothetical protein